MNDDYYFMELAIEEAIMSLNEGGIPIGAVLVKDGEVVSDRKSTRLNSSHAT